MPIKQEHDPNEYHKWFNPDGTQVEDLKSDGACATKDVPPLSGIPNPRHPVDVPPTVMFSIVTVRLEAFKVRNDGRIHPWCIPGETHVYLDLPGASEPVTFTEKNTGQTFPVPWDGITRTPWIAEATIMWSIGAEKKIGGKPSFTIDVSSRYAPQLDKETDDDVITYKCTVYMNAMKSPIVYDASLDVNKRGFIQCKATLQVIPML